MEQVQTIKQRFEIIGNDTKLNRAIEKAHSLWIDTISTHVSTSQSVPVVCFD